MLSDNTFVVFVVIHYSSNRELIQHLSKEQASIGFSLCLGLQGQT